MKRTSSKKLSISRVTLRHLSAVQLHRAAGGQTIWTCTDICTRGCDPDSNVTSCHLDTQFVHGCAG